MRSAIAVKKLTRADSRGLAYVDDGSSPRSLTRDLAPTVNLRATGADVVIDATPTPEAIEGALARLEMLARRQDGAVGLATALPKRGAPGPLGRGAGVAGHCPRAGLGPDRARAAKERGRYALSSAAAP